MLRLILAVVLASVIAGGCAASGAGRRSISESYPAAQARPAKPAKGNPEVYIVGATRKQAFDALVNRMNSSIWRVADANDHQLTFESDAVGAVGFTMQMLYGVAGKRPIYRILARGREVDGGTILSASFAVVAHPGTAAESVLEPNRKDWVPHVQELLDGVPAEAAKLQSAK